MKFYRTTKYYGDKVWFVRYSTRRNQFAAVKGALGWAYPPWHVRKGDGKETTRITLEVAEIPDDAWTTLEDMSADVLLAVHHPVCHAARWACVAGPGGAAGGS